MAGPVYNPRKRFVGDLDATAIATGQGWAIARCNDKNSTTATNEGNARLIAASDNAVIELAKHLGCNAVLLAERLEGGGLVRLVEALKEIGGYRHGTLVPDHAVSAMRDAANTALSHLTAPAPR